MIKIVVTKYPRDKWYQFNAGNILRIQHREGKAVTSISLTVSKPHQFSMVFEIIVKVKTVHLRVSPRRFEIDSRETWIEFIFAVTAAPG